MGTAYFCLNYCVFVRMRSFGLIHQYVFFLVPQVLLAIILGRYALFPEKIDICSFLETRFGLECQDPFKIKGFFSVVLKPLISSCLR